MNFRRYISGLFAGFIFLNFTPKPQAAVYSNQCFFRAIEKKIVGKLYKISVPDCVRCGMRIPVARVLYVMPSYWRIGSIYEMFARFGFPDALHTRTVDYLVELLGDSISPEEVLMLKNSENLDEIKANLQHMIIAYEFFIKITKSQLSENVRNWVDQNYQQFWKFGSEIKATAEPVFKLRRPKKNLKDSASLPYGNNREILVRLQSVYRVNVAQNNGRNAPVVFAKDLHNLDSSDLKMTDCASGSGDVRSTTVLPTAASTRSVSSTSKVVKKSSGVKR